MQTAAGFKFDNLPIKRDLKRAHGLLRAAAMTGHEDAQFQLAYLVGKVDPVQFAVPKPRQQFHEFDYSFEEYLAQQRGAVFNSSELSAAAENKEANNSSKPPQYPQPQQQQQRKKLKDSKRRAVEPLTPASGSSERRYFVVARRMNNTGVDKS